MLLWAGNTDAQQTFERYYSGVGTANWNLIELENGNYFTGMANESGTSVMNPQGIIQHSQCYAIDSMLGLQSVAKYTDNEFYFVTAYRTDSCTSLGTIVIPHIDPLIGKMDSLGNVLRLERYALNTDECMSVVNDLTVCADGSVIAWGIDNFVALRVDPTGAPVWAKQRNMKGSFQFFKELPSGDVLAGINMDTAGAVVARLDPEGNFLWCKSYIRPDGMVADCLVESDDSFIITGLTDSLASTDIFEPLPPDFHPKVFLMKLNGEGDVQWCKGYDSAPNLWYARQGARIARAQDGNYVVLGNLGEPGFNYPSRPFLMKTDQNGDTLWTRSTGRANADYLTVSMLACSDGGFMYAGQAFGSAGGMFLFKTNEQGYLPCRNLWQTVVVSDLFPTDSSFTFSSVDGAMAMPAFATPIDFEVLVPEDPCDGATSIQTWDRHTPRISIRPNPTPGRFTVEFQDPLMKDSYYSVYDAMGKLLLQRAATHGKKTEEVDLTGYAKGTYVIRFTDPDGVCFERVMLE